MTFAPSKLFAVVPLWMLACAPASVPLPPSDGAALGVDVASTTDAPATTSDTPVSATDAPATPGDTVVVTTPDAGTPPADVPLVEIDVPQWVDDVPVTTVDVPVVGVDVRPPPPDVPVTGVDVRPPPPDVPVVDPTCGNTGQNCCATGTACRVAGEGCLDWGWGRVCGACGGAGQTCCPGNSCSGGGSCVSLLNGGLSSCAVASARAETPGGSCTRPGMACGAGAGTACVSQGFVRAVCVSCGTRGLPCCWGGGCTGGSTCMGSNGSVLVCR